MSERHPIIAITGSSGAGTTSVTHVFENIFRREGVKAAIVEGDSFHRHDRAEMKLRSAEAERDQGRPARSPPHRAASSSVRSATGRSAGFASWLCCRART